MRIKLQPTDLLSLTLNDAELLKKAKQIKAEKGTFEEMLEKLNNGKLRLWRISGKCEALTVLGVEDGFLLIFFFVGRGIRGNHKELGKHFMSLVYGNNLKGMRAYTSSLGKARLFSAFHNVKTYVDGDRIRLELLSEDFDYGRR